jgi:hypothetical protein
MHKSFRLAEMNRLCQRPSDWLLEPYSHFCLSMSRPSWLLLLQLYRK